ncbi:hypothetical protein BU14_0172s0014 [Porphyra umbilicalis]|uniref:Uncharacterized protein n=1 Tax=Porphyra umbilicalis TaxID=2786 RepID=A0A1X6P7G3_PORUM|nr:hypothetical protein BU14_0172s0014 [Porphyra umbilicalis]|eukprot:OSX76832.1 hypothetical protein BU14_0172s0014 [Porphyra umbilicalis]
MGLTEESGDLLQGAAALITDLDGTLTETELLKAMSYARVMAHFFDCHQPDALRILSCEDRDIPALSKRVRTAVTSAERKLALPSPPEQSPPPSADGTPPPRCTRAAPKRSSTRRWPSSSPTSAQRAAPSAWRSSTRSTCRRRAMPSLRPRKRGCRPKRRAALPTTGGCFTCSARSSTMSTLRRPPTSARAPMNAPWRSCGRWQGAAGGGATRRCPWRSRPAPQRPTRSGCSAPSACQTPSAWSLVGTLWSALNPRPRRTRPPRAASASTCAGVSCWKTRSTG